VVDEPVTAEAKAERRLEPAPPEAPAERSSRWGWPLRAAVLAIVFALFALLAWATLTAGSGQSLVARIAAGEAPPAPSFSLEVLWRRAETWPLDARRRLTDGQLDLAELRGRPVVVNFWASWCIPCRDEAAILNASSRAHTGKVVFLGINVQDLREDALAFSHEFGTPYVSVRDRGNGTYDDFGLTGVPETYYVDARGRLVAHSPGAISRTSLEQGIAQAIGGAAR
jgi:cytochrome c biogenesis protein CcmG, thiol:disulfide interchange protein DsbE